jgi:hypothetical protein
MAVVATGELRVAARALERAEEVARPMVSGALATRYRR